MKSSIKNKEKIRQAFRLNTLEKIAKALLLKAFFTMKQGRMIVETPNGERYLFGNEPDLHSAEIKINSDRFWLRSIFFGDIGFAESYLDAEWDTPDLKAVISWFILNKKSSPVLEDSSTRAFWANVLGVFNRLIHRFRQNSLKGSKKNIEQHYDLSNEFFALFLDETMTYSSAKFANPSQTLEQAQIAKIDSICRKLKLKPEDRLLEIGTGWGSLAIHAAQNYGCHVTTITISAKQYEYAQNKIEKLGLSAKIEVILEDYRNIKGRYDKIVSVEMIEAVGEKYLDTFFSHLDKLLKEDGLICLQMIICPDSLYTTMANSVDFIQKHIFPGGSLPSLGRVVQSINRVGDLSIFEVEDIGMSYVKTLSAWYERFNANIDKVKLLGFDDFFVRKWNYYLQYCSAGFDMRNVSVVQTILTRPNNLKLREKTDYKQLSNSRGL